MLLHPVCYQRGRLFTDLKKLLGTVFVSSDVDVLAAMPLPGSTIAPTRVMVRVPFAYATTSCVIAPFIIGYMVSADIDAMLLASALLSIAIILAGVISIIAILLTLAMKAFRQVRNKDMLTVLGSIAAIVIIVAVNVISRGITNSATSDNGAISLISSLASVSEIAWPLPFAACLGRALTSDPLYPLAAAATPSAQFKQAHQPNPSKRRQRESPHNPTSRRGQIGRSPHNPPLSRNFPTQPHAKEWRPRKSPHNPLLRAA